MKAIIIIFLASIGFVAPCKCSAPSGGWVVVTSGHDTLRPCAIGAVDGSMVELRCGDSTVKTLIDSLSILTRRVTPQSLNKAKAGLVTGALVGAFIGLISSGSQSGPWHIGPGPGTAVLMGGVFGGTAGVLIGGFVGSEAGGDETYDLSRMTTGERVRVLRSVSLVYSN